MKKYLQVSKHFKKILKSRRWLLGMNILEIYIIFMLTVGVSSALYLTHKKMSPNVASSTSQGSGLTLPCGSVANSCVSNQPLSTTNASSNTAPAAATPKKGESCAQIESIFGPILNNSLASAWSIWSAASYDTPAEINYEYNLSAASDYTLYKNSMSEFGCPVILQSPTLKYPASAPGSSSTYTAPVLSCNTTQESVYTSQYNSAVQQENQSYENTISQDNGALAVLSSKGAGGSSAYEQILAMEAQTESQHTATLNQLKNTYQSELTSINC